MKESVLWPILQRARNHATSQSDMLGTNFDVDKFERKFAELLVLECIDQCFTDDADRIARHFDIDISE
jgi:hypothetical protein